ncbi:MFS transporter [candidate division KSB1 bacterium]|nr:MFS transporter [candidate division KSB1 bacterium]
MNKKKAVDTKKSKLSPWYWVPTLYYAEGIPYIIVMTVSVIMYKRLGLSNTQIALYTSWLYLPWVIKPLWSPLVDIIRTKRFWIISMQLVIGAALAGIALTIPTSRFLQFTLAFFWLLAFSSATHDIAADGFYMLGMSQHQQAWFVGIRNTFYRFAMLTGQGLLVILAGYIESGSGLETIDYKVRATNSPVETVKYVHPDSLKIEEQPGDLRIIISPETVDIPTGFVEPDSFKHVNTMVTNWNVENGYSEPIKTAEQMRISDNWFKRNISKKVESGLISIFGRNEAVRAMERRGNFALVYIHLSKPPEPEKKYVVNFGKKSGANDIALQGREARAEFTSQNWNKPLLAIIQVDPKLTEQVEATYVARAGDIELSWIVTFVIMAILFGIFCIYHKFIMPHPAEDVPRASHSMKEFFISFGVSFSSFFKKKGIGLSLAFLLLYRLGESQLVKIASPFLLDAQEKGGLALTTGELGFVYGTIGMLMLTIGGLLGGFVAAKQGLKKWIFWMAIAINLPDATYIVLAYTQTTNFALINACVGIEQFGYGFGFTAYMLYMIYISEGDFKTSHYAICTAFMALGMMIPGMISGWIQSIIGYPSFFIWVLISTIPGIILVNFLRIDPNFGKNTRE